MSSYTYKYKSLKNNINPKNKVFELINFKYKPKKLTLRRQNDTIGDVIWKNKNKNKITTNLNMLTKISNKKYLPQGLKLGSTNTMTSNDKKILDSLFIKFKDTHFSADYGTSIDIFSKLNKDSEYKGNRMSVNQVLKVVNDDQSHVKLINFYFTKCLQNLNISQETSDKMKLKDKVTFEILKYKDKTAKLHCHIDNLKGGSGPIITINVGPDFYYDLIPLLFNKDEVIDKKNLRLSINENQLIIMDGEVRNCWQHCIPEGIKIKKDKYTIKLIFPRIKKKNPIYNNFLKENLTTSF